MCYDFCFRSSPPVVPDQLCRGFSHTNIASSFSSLLFLAAMSRFELGGGTFPCCMICASLFGSLCDACFTNTNSLFYNLFYLNIHLVRAGCGRRVGWSVWRNDDISNQADRHVLSPHISNQADRHVLSPHFQSSVGLVLLETVASGGKGHRFGATGKDWAWFPGGYLGGTAEV